jgi:FkbM family methyltransferase
MWLRTKLRKAAQRFGWDIHLHDPDRYPDPWEDMTLLLKDKKIPIAFDVGANVGQTVRRMREVFPTAIIHAFEPSPLIFTKLEAAVPADSSVVVNNCGVGAHDGILEFSENSASEMSSFLPLGPEGWGGMVGKMDVPVVTVDSYCRRNAISEIDILKIDTQGFDFEVLKGADRMLSHAQIGLVFVEITFARLYEHLPRFDAVFRFLADRAYRLVAVYDHHRHNRILMWTDVMFASPAIVRAMEEQNPWTTEGSALKKVNLVSR